MKHLLVSIQLRDGRIQKRLVNLDRYCMMGEVETEDGPRVVIKFFPVSQNYGDDERPIYALETMDDIVDAIDAGDPRMAYNRRVHNGGEEAERIRESVPGRKTSRSRKRRVQRRS